MNILVLNAGSSSHKLCCYSLNDTLPVEPPKPVWRAQLDWHPEQNQVDISIHSGRKTHQEHRAIAPQPEIVSDVIQTLWQGPAAPLSQPKDINVVGHRVVHGGSDYRQSTVVTSAVKASINQLSTWAPVHNPLNLAGIELMEHILPEIPQVAVFDTAFHSQMPRVSATYPGPYRWFDQGIRRYGFHGISHQYCAQRAAQLLGRPLSTLRLVICHLGNGGSLTAVKHGQSIDTTMGFTPLDGLMMGTRSGAVDPGILIYLMRQGYTADEIDHLLNQDSGLKGISGISNDLRAIKPAIVAGEPRAKLAWELYLHRLKACLGSMIMSLEGLDAIVFTAGIGEHNPELRAAVCKSIAFLGVALDDEKNKTAEKDQNIATPNSSAAILMIHTQEDWAIAQDCWWLLSQTA